MRQTWKQRLPILLLVVVTPLLGVLFVALMLRSPATAPAPLSCRQDPADLPPPPPGPEGRPANYLHTCGGRLYDATGREVRISGLNWFGMETNTHAPHGLWARNWREVLDQIAALGYNTIRLPYSNDVLLPGQLANGISGPLNPDLEGIAALDLLDKLVEGARERGLKIILDRHRPTAAAQSSLWYTKEVSEEVWIEDWRMLAERYRGNDTVIGVDLHNEPRESAAWGGGDPLTDWRLAAERAGTAIQEVNPYLLILVQGVERYHDDWYWWGGDLQGVRTDPVRLAVPNRVVYSPHDYGPGVYEQGWFQDPRFPANLPEVWDRRWGYIQREGIAPVVVGEFGGRLAGNPRERQWQQALINYLKAYQIGALNWALNPNSGDTGGILDGDWLSVVQDKQDIYAQLLAPPLDLGLSGAFGRAPTRLSLQFRQTETAQRAGNVGFVLRIANDGPDPLDLSRLEARYWFNADGASGSPQEVVIDWAEMGAEQVQAAIVPVLRDAQSAYLRLRFGAKAGAVPPYRTSGAVQVRLHRSDWTPYDQSNDYSFRSADAPPSGQMQPWDRVTLYRDGRLVWGIEP